MSDDDLARLPGADASVERARLTVDCGALARPLASRFVAALAAGTALSIDRVDEACLLVETIVDRCTELTPDGRVELSVAVHEDRLELRIIGLATGAGTELLRRDAAEPQGGAIRGLASSVEVRPARGEGETLKVVIGQVARKRGGA